MNSRGTARNKLTKSDLIAPITTENLAQLSFERLEQAIMSGQLEPGEKISESLLARRFGISRGPLREAIGRLEGLGLVTRVANQGTRVNSLSETQLMELLIMREAVEGMPAAMRRSMRLRWNSSGLRSSWRIMRRIP